MCEQTRKHNSIYKPANTTLYTRTGNIESKREYRNLPQPFVGRFWGEMLINVLKYNVNIMTKKNTK